MESWGHTQGAVCDQQRNISTTNYSVSSRAASALDFAISQQHAQAKQARTHAI